MKTKQWLPILYVFIGFLLGKWIHSRTTISDLPQSLDIGIFSAPNHFTRRSLIRLSYPKDVSSKYRFIVSKPKTKAEVVLLMFEQRVYKDVLVLNHDIDDFEMLQSYLKAVKSTGWVLKTNDQVWVHVYNFEKFVRRISKTNLVYTDNVEGEDRFGYLFSIDVVAQLVDF
jgi:hypothetical protein